LDSAKEKLDGTKEELRTSKEEHRKTKEELSETKTKLSETKSKLDETKDKLKTANEKIEDLRDRVKKARGNNNNNNNQVEASLSKGHTSGDSFPMPNVDDSFLDDQNNDDLFEVEVSSPRLPRHISIFLGFVAGAVCMFGVVVWMCKRQRINEAALLNALLDAEEV